MTQGQAMGDGVQDGLLARLGWKLVKKDLPVGDARAPLTLWLRQLVRLGHGPDGPDSSPGHSVLLLHGGNTNGDTYLHPVGGLAVFLAERGWRVWLLEWRASPHVLEPVLARDPLGGSLAAERDLFTLDGAADVDIPAGLREIRRIIGPEATLSVVGHCLGGGALSMAIARGRVEEFGVRDVVLSTMGLFYEVPWNGWIKTEDFFIERILSESPEEGAETRLDPRRAVDPKRRDTWPAALQELFERWPSAWLPADDGTAAEEMLRSLTFMFGQPYSSRALDERVSGPLVESFFGPMHMGLFQHAGQLVRRGYAARMNAPDVIDRGRRFAGEALAGSDDDLKPRYFANKRVRLITAADNHLWHRDSMDLMYEWLCRIGTNPRERYSKYVFAGYNIQELLWGPRARDEVFPAIAGGLAAIPASAAVSQAPSDPPPPGHRAAVSIPGLSSSGRSREQDLGLEER